MENCRTGRGSGRGRGRHFEFNRDGDDNSRLDGVNSGRGTLNRGRLNRGRWENRERYDSRNSNRGGDRKENLGGNRNATPYDDRKFNNSSNQGYQRKYPMGFKYVEELLKNDDLEDVMFILNNDKKGFKELLEDKGIANDMIVLLVELLSKVSVSSFTNLKIHILQMVLRSGFLDNVSKFIATLAIQDARDKRNSSYFWRDCDRFWNNILNICRIANDVIPTTSCQIIIKMLTAMKLYMPVIESHHSMHISDEIKANVESLHDVVNETVTAIEKKRIGENSIDKVFVEQEPPDDFRDINVYPNAIEITSLESPFLRRNITEGPYQSVHQYLDIQFRLLREDFVAPLRNGICKYLENKKQKLDDIRIHYPVHFLHVEIVNEQNCYRLQYDFSKKKKSHQFEKSRRLMFGSLLCFTNDNFVSIIFGKVVQRKTEDLDMGQIIVGFDPDIVLPETLCEGHYLMVESNVYFEPYYHVLNVLTKMQPDNFPMEKYIIKVKTDTQPPAYLLQIDPVFYEIEDCKFWPLSWNDDKRFYGLNDAQHLAFKAALTQEFSIIQGPPGTGKTFLGLKIAHTLINNLSAWYNRTPILVICYTNHALDQFLEGLLEVTDRILRVGSQSKNEKLNEFNIRFHRREFSNSTVHQMRRQIRSLLEEIGNINETLKQITLNMSILNFSVFSDVVPHYNKTWFSTADNDAILHWLFGARVEKPKDHHEAASIHNLESVNDNNEVNEALETDEKQLDDDVFNDLPITTSGPLITMHYFQEKVKDLENILQSYQNCDFMDKSFQDLLQEERVASELDIAYRDLRYFERKLSENTQGMKKIEPEFVDLLNPSRMPPAQRWQLYWYWLEQYENRLLHSREIICRKFQKNFKIFNEMREMEDAQIMKSCLVVGMTTSGAARLQSSLQSLRSPIVIVEEAAEVLEAHIISSLTNHCRHLILIGDHQQLKPCTANFKVETKYRLGISLFERMILNKIQCYTLNVQHRMRPEISCLICPTIYPALIDHESVLNRPPILGVENCVYFIDHQEPEQLCNDSSKANEHETKFLINLAKHLVLNGYEPENIIILAAYLGQMFGMQREKRKHDLLLQDVRIAVLDNYQGEESDIVLLSLVRNNTDNKIGFLKIENRVCVALSRARNGFYMMGNMKLLCDNSVIWPKIKDSLEKQNGIGSHLTLRCQIHKHKVTHIKSPDDFLEVAEGGCNLMCESKLGCDHVCKRLCHIEDREHTHYKCRETCKRVLCDNQTHICQKLCYEECGPCTYPIEYNLDCGHTVTVECHINIELYQCITPIPSTLPCGHETQKPCHRDPETIRCPHPCDIRVEPCGHACSRTCHIKDDPDHLEYKCRKQCVRYCKGCSLPDDKKHPCSKFCFEDCDECTTMIKKHRTVCPHVYQVACKDNVDDICCEKPCKKILSCGHTCKNKCNEPCGNCSKLVEKEVPDCKHLIKLACSKEADRALCRGVCPRLLVCGHKCLNKCFETCTKSCQIQVECSISSPCGHIVKTIKCYLKDTANPEDLLKFCTERCNTKLKCGHICSGTCGKCFQGRIHQKCQEKCGVPLICNHECPIPCRSACKPCEKKCEYRCIHTKCSRDCGNPCNMCKESCTRNCEHQKCGKKCGDFCDVMPCEEPCKKKLKCGHPCVGFCGDPCPILCRICNYEELTAIFLGSEDEKEARYVMLRDCKHIFESGDLERWLNLDSNEVKQHVCPKCKTAITTTQRYNEYIKNSMNDIMKVKNELCGSREENDKKRKLLLEECMETRLKIDIQCPMKVNNALDMLAARLRESRQKGKEYRRQTVNKMDLYAIQSKLQLVQLMITLLDTKEEEKLLSTKYLPQDKCLKQVSFILDVLMCDEDRITDQQRDDVTLEIERLSRFVQYEKIQNAANFKYAMAADTTKNIANLVSKLLESQTRYNKETDLILHANLTELNKLVASSIAITEVEKREIVRALGLQKGHWFKCPNGHYYVITECGGATQISKCNECGVEIGGRSHQLLPNQRHAPEMDNSSFPAWSEAANLANYRL